MEQKPTDNEDRIKQLVEEGNRLEAAAVHADREGISFQEARAYIDKTFPIEEYPVKPPPQMDNNTGDERSTGGAILGCLTVILVFVILVALGIAIRWAILHHFYPQYPDYLSYLKSWDWVKPSLYSIGGFILILIIYSFFKKN